MDKHQIKSRQVSPLPIGSGGNNATKQQLNSINTNLTMMTSQAVVDTKYDPPVPQHITKPSTIENFQVSHSIKSVGIMTAVLGSLIIIYSIVTK